LSEASDPSQETPVPEIVDNDIPAVGEIGPPPLNDDLAGAFEFGKSENAFIPAGRRCPCP
jgi:hypothetical protein